MDIKVRNILGENISIEDAILLREIVRTNINIGVTIDFEGFEKISSVFLNCLLSDLINKFGREYIFKQVNVKNLSNYTDFSRVVLGTTFQ
ncbi:STAS-like domain-containing protein [Clostridium gasigenes]|uniref:STAS-like domain-containing protein n=1 Tax=Clostridium gasigenes TaxID=94869 RepID=A0A7X0SDR4_9CLOT|nr:STAS-like domain-containing protein [Clostridium gasigenes]MBB6623753.1 STAS-like domain-containing protein [Clostridium gasigenes]MBB6715734.1 STAS-like domain-containing protein [Clostridium gasigenes]MBU3105694.1 STAS-like domain-containing protein [Clostridium gasigenes]MBU3109229.1 STAS-like domain-containing protein [Clostridium gasigenes]MBU3134113.1 STAS-like domain-containing protein [Clostridium gasigenes]